MFTLGMACWWVGPRGAAAGAAAGALVAGTVSLGTQAAAARGLRAPPLDIPSSCALNTTYVIEDMLVSCLLCLGTVIFVIFN